MSGVGDLQIVGLRRFGQVQATSGDLRYVTVFDGADDRSTATITIDDATATANTLTPEPPPVGWAGTGFGDLVAWKPNTPDTISALDWPWAKPIAAVNLLFVHSDESDADFWLLQVIETGALVLAFPAEVTLVEPNTVP